MAPVVSESPTRIVYPYPYNRQPLYIREKYEEKDTILFLTFYRTRVSQNLHIKRWTRVIRKGRCRMEKAQPRNYLRISAETWWQTIGWLEIY